MNAKQSSPLIPRRNVYAPIMPEVRGLVASAIFRDPKTRRAFEARFAELATNFFVAPFLTRRIDQQAARLQIGLKRYDPDLAREVMNHADSLKDRINDRAQSLADQLKTARTGEGSDPK